MNFNRLKDCVVTNKNVIVRVDINVPIKDGKITDDTRIKAVIPTLKYLADNKAKVIIISHFGRPKGQKNVAMSLSQTINKIQELLKDIKVNFVDDCIGDKVKNAISNTNYGEVVLLENLRFYAQEEQNDVDFAQKLAELGNLYVNDAFSCSHRAHASIVGIAGILKSAAGFLMEKELDNLSKLLDDAQRPMMAVIGGAKISTKINLVKSLSKKCDAIVIAGAMANTFLYAKGQNVGKSLFEKDYKDVALQAIKEAKTNNCQIILPKDVVVTKKLENNSDARNITIDEMQDDDIIADLGQDSMNHLTRELKNYKTLLWNGPLGAFEIKPFNKGSEDFAKIIANLTENNDLISIAGGGDSVAAINAVNLANNFSYISTAGGAFLEYLEGKKLPGILALTTAYKKLT